MTRILCVAGEVSGDRLMAPMIRGLREQGVGTIGVGGDECIAAGLDAVAHANQFCVGGITEVLGSVPRGLRLLRKLQRVSREVDGLLLVDWPEINLRLLTASHLDPSQIAYVSPPQAWAWRPGRAKVLRKAGLVGCLFPFEADWYRERASQALYLGHPFATLAPLPKAERPGVALLPGSRRPYVSRLMPLQLAAFAQLHEADRTLQGHIGCAPTIDSAWVQQQADRIGVPVTLHGSAHEALAASTVAMVGVGTVALEAALNGRPYVAMAKLSPVSAAVGRALIRTDHYSLPNLILKEAAFPELIQEACTETAITRATMDLLVDEGVWQRHTKRLRDALEGGAGSSAVVEFFSEARHPSANMLDVANGPV
jgi:lipid-A-disaccharide synthase